MSSSTNVRRTLVFAPETLNLAEVTRMIEIARVARRSFDVVFLSYDAAGRNHPFIERAGFRIVRLEPQLSEARVAHFWRKNRGESLYDDYFPDAELRARVEAERAFYASVNAAAVVTGFCLSTSISARVAGVPLVWINHTTWLREYFERFGTWPDAIDYAPFRLLPERLRNLLARWATPFTFWLLNKGFDRVARSYGLRGFRGSELLEGDLNLFAEPPSFSGLEVPTRLEGRCRFIGPLYGGLDLPIPEAVAKLPRDRPIVYFAMGSSGSERRVAEIVRAFEGQPYRVIAPVAGLMQTLKLLPPDNVVVTGWLPAERVNPLASVSVVHGGIGTLMTACRAGTPIVGIPNGNPEQECNLQSLVRKGIAVHLHGRRIGPRDVLDAVATALEDGDARARAQAFEAELAAYDGPENAARALEEAYA